MENTVINVAGVDYVSQPETEIGGCDGCAFAADVGDYLCNEACTLQDCFEDEIIWKSVKDKPSTMSKQVGGTHYQKKIQPWDIIHEWKLDYWRGNVVKYVLRCKEKNGIEDLKKAVHYLEYAIENYEEDIK